MADFTHFDDNGNARMVDVGDKEPSDRVATAAAAVIMKPETLKLITDGGITKGDVLSIARLAGIMGAKRTPDLIPLCHPLSLSSIEIDLSCDAQRNAVDITATCRVSAKTGVEMEALTAVSVAALTVYDMCKAVDRGMTITDIRLTYKAGGKSGTYHGS